MNQSENNVILISFGLDRPVPKGYSWCFLCDGRGKDPLDEKQEKSCEACKGKGHHDRKDITDYHRKYPELCRISCGKSHLDE